MKRKLKIQLGLFLGLVSFINSGCFGNSISIKDQEITKNIRYINAKANIWQLEFLDANLLVTADYNGIVSLKNIETGENVWSFPSGSFIFDLKTGDIDGDGHIETAFVTAQGDMVILDEKGKKRWAFHSTLPLYNVGIGNFTSDSKLEIACGGIDRFVYVFDADGRQISKSEKMDQLVFRIATGNLQGDGHDEILVIENRITANLLAFADDSLVSVWRKPLKVSDELINWENPRGSFFPFSIEIDDLDGDGTNEIIMGDTFFNKQAVMVTNNQAEPLWISNGLSPFSQVDGKSTEFYSTAFVRCADIFLDHPGKEVISVAGGMFRIWDKNGNLLGEQNSQLGFTDFEVRRNELILGSCPNGDEYIYSIKIDNEWEKAVADLEFQGLIKDIKDNNARFRKLVNSCQSQNVPQKKYDIIDGFSTSPINDKGLIKFQKQKKWFQRTFPYNNFRSVSYLKVIEKTPPLDNNGNPWSIGRWTLDAINGTKTIEQIVENARWIERNKIPTLFYIGHSCSPFITLETAKKILQAAPIYCVGFQTSEDEVLERIPQYFEHYFRPLANLCLKYGNKICVTKDKGLWWMSSPSDPEVFSALFEGGREKVSMAATEDSNSRTPEMNLMGRGGLWQAGLIQHNDVSIHADMFSYNRFFQWEYPRIGNQYLRLFVAHTTMGMTQINSRIHRLSPGSDSTSYDSIGQESTEIFYHMLGKGIVFSPDRQDILGYSPIGMVIHKPEQKWLEDAHNGHAPEKWNFDPELEKAVFPHNGCEWGITNTPDYAFQKVIFNKERQFGCQIPATPYGLVAFVPEFTNLKNVANVKEWWYTDGIYIWKDQNNKYAGKEAADLLLSDFKKAAEKLPFRQTGEVVFMNVVRLTDDNYRIYLVDPGWINPKESKVNVKIQLDGEFEAHELLSNEQFNIQNQSFQVTVPAGLFTIIDVCKKGPNRQK